MRLDELVVTIHLDWPTPLIPDLDGRLTQPKSPYQSRYVASQLTDDFLQRLINAIEEQCHYEPNASDYATVDLCVKDFTDGDDFLAYQRIKELFCEAYPELYGDDDE